MIPLLKFLSGRREVPGVQIFQQRGSIQRRASHLRLKEKSPERIELVLRERDFDVLHSTSATHPAISSSSH